jgi:hypothetical protein
MNAYIGSKLPTIYADMNIYRYVAYADISIKDPNRFLWVYSHVHLDEICRNGNTDALDGMKVLGAIEISDILDEKFQSVGNIVLREYIDPNARYEQHLDAISGYEDTSDLIVEQLIRSFGADNFEELRKTPDQMCDQIDSITSILDNDTREELIKKAKTVSIEMKESIEKHLSDRMPVDKTRRAMGITSEDRKSVEGSHSPLDEIWEIISPSVPNISKDQFFGFKPIPGIEGVQTTQHGSIAGAHIVLNMLGISPDKGLAKRDKIKNIMSDGQHVGMASYCNALLSADQRFSNKARAIYTYLGNITNALSFEYQKGYVLNLGIIE